MAGANEDRGENRFGPRFIDCLHPSATPEATPATHPNNPASPSLADILRIAALVLLFAGAAVAIVSLVAARRV